MSTSPPPLHIYFILLPSPGHVIPMLDIAKLCVKHSKVECTLILTPLNASRFNSTIYHSDLKLLTFQFPSIKGFESTDVLPSLDLLENFFVAVSLLEQPFWELVCNDPLDAVVLDVFLPWAAIASTELKIPHYSFSSTSCFALSVERSLFYTHKIQRCLTLIHFLFLGCLTKFT